MGSRERIKYVIGIGVLFFVGLMGGNIFWTSIEIGFVYGLIQALEGGGRSQEASTKRLLCLDFLQTENGYCGLGLSHNYPRILVPSKD